MDGGIVVSLFDERNIGSHNNDEDVGGINESHIGGGIDMNLLGENEYLHDYNT